MLDSFIIERSRQERAQRDSGLQPLRIHVPRPEDDPRYEQQRRRDEDERSRHEDDRSTDRGVVIIDYNV